MIQLREQARNNKRVVIAALALTLVLVVILAVPALTQTLPRPVDRDTVTLSTGDTIEIGNHDTKDFEPFIKLNKWGGEAWLKLWLPTAEKNPAIKDGDLLKWNGTGIEARFYPINDKESRDGFEFEIALAAKPATNVITLRMESLNLVFNYQPALTQKDIDEGSIRPDNVVGSYAVYHQSERNGQYKAGKAFHWYRPRIEDSKGTWVWGELFVDAQAGIATITIPQSFLDKAAYPIRHVSGTTLGFSASGGSDQSIVWRHLGTNNSRRAGTAWTANETMVISSIKAYLKGVGVGDLVDVKASINLQDDPGADSHDLDFVIENTDVSDSGTPYIETFAAAGQARGIDSYLLNVHGSYLSKAGNNDHYVRYDTGTNDSYLDTNQSYSGPEDPWTQTVEGTKKDYSIWLEYTLPTPTPGPTSTPGAADTLSDVKHYPISY